MLQVVRALDYNDDPHKNVNLCYKAWHGKDMTKLFASATPPPPLALEIRD